MMQINFSNKVASLQKRQFKFGADGTTKITETGIYDYYDEALFDNAMIKAICTMRGFEYLSVARMDFFNLREFILDSKMRHGVAEVVAMLYNITRSVKRYYLSKNERIIGINLSKYTRKQAVAFMTYLINYEALENHTINVYTNNENHINIFDEIAIFNTDMEDFEYKFNNRKETFKSFCNKFNRLIEKNTKPVDEVAITLLDSIYSGNEVNPFCSCVGCSDSGKCGLYNDCDEDEDRYEDACIEDDEDEDNEDDDTCDKQNNNFDDSNSGHSDLIETIEILTDRLNHMSNILARNGLI